MSKELELAIKISGKIDRSLGSALNNAQKQLDSIHSTTNKALMAATMATAAATGKLIVDSVQTYKDYQTAADSAAATYGIERGTAEYQMMDEAARAAGRATVKTAAESANALEYMALAGWSVQDSTQALMPVLKLSAATNTDLATTSDLVTDSMANLGLGINDLNHYLDVSAAANNKSNQTAMQLQEAYLGVGGTLKNLNAPIEESAAILGVLANRGTKGSEAGTALSAILVNMQKQGGDAAKAMAKLDVSMYDSMGNARSIIDVFEEINNKTAGMTTEQRNLMFQMIGGKSHVGSFSKIMAGFTDTAADGTREVYSLINAFENCDGALDKLYGIKTDTLGGSLATLNSAFDDMKISIGEEISPELNDMVKSLTDKMPQIEAVITESLEKIIPVAANVMEYMVDNADVIIDRAYDIAKAFAIFKIGTGAINGINSIAILGKNLKTISATAGAVPVMKGVFATLTGVSGAGAAASIVSTLGPLALLAGGFVAVGTAINAAYDAWYDYNYKWGNSLELQSHAVSAQADEVLKLKDYQKELSQLEFVINSPESSAEEVNAAQSKLEEIAQMLSKEYNLTINVDSGNLSQAAEDATKVLNALEAQQRLELNENVAKYIGELNSATERYQTATANLPQKQAERDALNNNNQLLSGLLSSAVIDANAYSISGDLTAYTAGMQEIATKLKDTEIFDRINEKMPKAINPDNISAELVGADTLDSFLSAMHAVSFDINKEFTDADSKLNDLNASIEKFNTSANSTGDSLMKILANDIINGNVTGIESATEQFKELGKTLINAGANTDGVAVKFAMAQMGYTNFADVIANGKATEAAQSFYDYQTAIGVSAEAATAGAALIQNGFENAAQATAAGNDAILGVIANINSLGAMNGVFDGLTNTADIEAKLTGIARAMNLIPANKAVKLDVNGNLSLIEQTAAAVNETPQAHNTELTTSGSALQTVNELDNALKNLPTQKNVNITVTQSGSIPTATTVINGSHYSGLERVPFDGYIAELHKDERVLTAEEAAVYNSRDDSPASIDVLRETIFGTSNSGGGGQRQFVFSPQITVQGNADKETITRTIKMTYSDFIDFMEEYESDNRRKRF